MKSCIVVLVCLSVHLHGLRMNLDVKADDKCQILPDSELIISDHGSSNTHTVTKEETWKTWHHDTYRQNEFRLQKAMQKLMDESRTEEFRVVGLGGSISALDCGSPEAGNWVHQLREMLVSKFGSRVKVTNLAMPGTTSANAFQAYHGDAHIFTKVGGDSTNRAHYKETLDAADLIVSEYHFNDLFHGSAESANEKLLFTLVNLPKKPAILYLDLPGPKNIRQHYFGSMMPEFDKSLHYKVAKKFSVPTIWFTDLERQIDFDIWHGGNHPHCFTETIMAKLVHDVLQDTMTSVCKDGVKGADAVFPKTDEIRSWFKCAHQTAFSADASKGESTFPVKSAGQWAFQEDRPGKPGWIAPEGEPQEIVFTGLPIKVGGLTIEYLQTYENIGSLTCMLEKPGTTAKSITLNGLWEERVSLKSVSQTLDIAPGKYDLRCRSDGKKFKLTGIQTC